MIDRHSDGSESGLRDRLFTEQIARLKDQIDALDERINQRADLADKTLEVAKEGLNSMRQMATDAQIAFLTRTEYGARHGEIENRIGNLAEKLTTMQGIAKGWQILLATLVSIAVISGLVWPHLH